ncbi:hypothetical protein BJF90_14630 [Pseudonocardia sp. CNS-004]|nr:hypothetical protein BJF90_14630 [Pseudonocardia sp. CNS-004]
MSPMSRDDVISSSRARAIRSRFVYSTTPPPVAARNSAEKCDGDRPAVRARSATLSGLAKLRRRWSWAWRTGSVRCGPPATTSAASWASNVHPAAAAEIRLGNVSSRSKLAMASSIVATAR